MRLPANNINLELLKGISSFSSNLVDFLPCRAQFNKDRAGLCAISTFITYRVCRDLEINGLFCYYENKKDLFYHCYYFIKEYAPKFGLPEYNWIIDNTVSQFKDSQNYKNNGSLFNLQDYFNLACPFNRSKGIFRYFYNQKAIFRALSGWGLMHPKNALSLFNTVTYKDGIAYLKEQRRDAAKKNEVALRKCIDKTLRNG